MWRLGWFWPTPISLTHQTELTKKWWQANDFKAEQKHLSTLTYSFSGADGSPQMIKTLKTSKAVLSAKYNKLYAIAAAEGPREQNMSAVESH